MSAAWCGSCVGQPYVSPAFIDFTCWGRTNYFNACKFPMVRYLEFTLGSAIRRTLELGKKPASLR